MDPKDSRKQQRERPQPGGQYLHAQHDNVTKAEQFIVQKYNKRMFTIGLLLAVVVPPLIYRWKRNTMAVRWTNPETRRGGSEGH